MLFIFLMGNSNAGKDTVCQLLQDEIPLANIKFSQPLKDMIETVYGLHHGALNDKEFRRGYVPTFHDGTTWTDLLVKCFDNIRAIDPKMMIQKVIRDVKIRHSVGQNMAFTDVRGINEWEAIKKIIEPQHDVVMSLWVNSPRETPKPSDRYQSAIYAEIEKESDIVGVVENSGTEAELKDLVVTLTDALFNLFPEVFKP